MTRKVERRSFLATSTAVTTSFALPSFTAQAIAAEDSTKISSEADCDVYQVTVKLKTPKSGKDKRAPRPLDSMTASVFIPAGVKTLRGATLNPFHEPTVGQKHWRAAVSVWKFAHVGLNLFGVKGDELGESTLNALQALAEASGHPELAHAPLCIHGMSAGGGMSSRLVEAFPSRVIASAPVCLEVGPRDKASGRVPMITVFGEKDGRQMEKLMEKLPIARADGAYWAIAPQWNKKHEWAEASNIVIPFYDQMIAARLPANADATSGPVKLLPLKGSEFYLGEPATWRTPSPEVSFWGRYDGDRGKMCFLPNAYTAALWQSFVTHGSPLKITSPHGISSANPFQPFAAGKPLEVKVSVKDGFDADKIELFDGDQRLAEVDRETSSVLLEELKPGIYALIAVASNGDGMKVYSAPQAMVVS